MQSIQGLNRSFIPYVRTGLADEVRAMRRSALIGSFALALIALVGIAHAQTKCGPGGVVCPAGQECVFNPGMPTRCVVKGACGNAICNADQVCLPPQKCYPKGSVACAASVCDPSQVCLNNKCYAKGAKLCGTAVCSDTQECVTKFGQPSRCAPKGACGDSICSPNHECLNDKCYPKGSQLCGLLVCDASQDCLNKRCVAKGSSPCGSSICAPAQKCLNNRCVAK